MMTSNAKDYRSAFRPEVLGRLDAMLEYNALGNEVTVKIVEKLDEGLNQRLKDKSVALALSDELRDELIKRGVDETYGARPLKSAFQQLVTRPLSELLLIGQLPEGKVEAYWDQGATKFRKS